MKVKENWKKLNYTVDDAIEKMGFGLFQVILTLVCSLIWLADAMQCTAFFILPFVVRCQWELSSVEEATLAMIASAGEFIGAAIWGLSADAFGRKKTIIGMISIMLAFGLLSAVKITSDDRRIPGFPWLLLCRLGVGIGTVGMPQITIYYIEFIPKKARGICSVFVSGWYSVGSILGVVCALVTMEYLMLGWHWYLAMLVPVLALALVSILFLPESARYLCTKGKQEKAVDVLKKVSWFNCKTLPEGQLITTSENALHPQGENNGFDLQDLSDDSSPTENHLLLGDNEKGKVFKQKVLLLFTDGMWRVTAILQALWVGTLFLYIGNILLTPTILTYNPHCGDYGDTGNYSNATTCADYNLDSQDYMKIIYTNFAELLGATVSLLLIEVIGRKLTLASILLLTMLGFSLLFICTGPVLLTAFLFLIKAFALNTMRIVYVYTSEVYPTSVRGLGAGVMSFIARIGEFLAPLVSQVLFSVSDYAAIGTYVGVSLVLAILTLLLPIETKQRLLG